MLDNHCRSALIKSGLICLLLCGPLSCLSRKADPHCAVVGSSQLATISTLWAEVNDDKSVKWSSKALGCEMGPYIVFVPISNDTEEQPNIMVLRGTNDAVLYIMGSSRCLWEDMRPIVCVEDQDNDGAVDQLYYSIYKDGFADELQVVDQDFDGQADSRFRIRTGEDVVIWLWVEDGWYEKVKGGRLVLVNGAETPYRLSNGKYVFGGEEEQ